ncbi:hypothetical protein K502DRAFT_258437 [Neoconidiobolus thromboides FSU 785]|nr:hypothetical protein K502DRAFT_258437 [Neoconidiobolus thromboides FSU 785]
MLKEFRVINCSFVNNKIVKSKKRQKDRIQQKQREEDLKNGIKELGTQLCRIFKLIETLDSFSDDDFPLSYPQSLFYSQNAALELKVYLKWVLETLKHKNIDDMKDDSYLSDQGITLKRKLYLIEETLSDQFSSSSNYIALRNRAGRGTEHVGNSPNSFDYGSFLETSIHYHDCFVYGTGFYFEPKELVSYIKQIKPGFMSRAIITSLSFEYTILPGNNFGEIYHNCLNSVLPLISQSCYNSSFESLKALGVLYDIFLVQSNYQLSYQILGSLVRMSYILGIDKLDSINHEIYNKSEKEIKYLVDLKKLWAWIALSAKVSEEFYGDFPLIKEFDLSGFEFIYHLTARQLKETNHEKNGCKKALGLYKNQMIIVHALIFDHREKNLKGVKNINDIPYSKLILPFDKFNLVQNYINKYYKSSIKSLNNIITNRNEPINIDNYLCLFSSNYSCIFKTVHEIRKSLSIYFHQLFLIYPTMYKTPIQLDIPLTYIPTLLETSLRTLFIYRALAFVYFKDIFKKMNIDNLQNEKTYKIISDYIESQPHHVINYNTYDCLIIMYNLEFRYPLFSFYALLQILSSPSIPTSGLIGNEAINIIEINIIELLQIYKLGMSLTKDKDRMDIEFTVNKVKSAINSLQLPSKLKTTFSNILC